MSETIERKRTTFAGSSEQGCGRAGRWVRSVVVLLLFTAAPAAPAAGIPVRTPLPTDRQNGPSAGTTFLTVSEIMYHPAARADGLDLEFLELHNSDPVPCDVGGYRVSGDVDYTLPAGTVIPGGGYLVVAKDPAALQAAAPSASVLGPYSNELSNAGGTVRVWNRWGARLLEVEYDDDGPWPTQADGAGHSLVLACPDFGENDRRAWSASLFAGGSPGAADPLPAGELPAVVINEFLAHTDPPQVDFVELYNASTQSVDLSGWVLTDDPSTNRFVIPPSTVIAARGFAVFDQNALGFGLGMQGDDIHLVDTNAGRVVDAVRFPAQANGVATGRFPDGGPEFRVLAGVTPGARNSGLIARDVVLNEIMFHPISGDSDDEYVELYNRGAAAVDLGSWRLVDGISFVFPPGTRIAAGACLVVARNPARLMAAHPQLNATNTLGGYAGSLSDRGERITLVKPDDPDLPDRDFVVMDTVEYDDGWGAWTDGGGSSLELIDPHSDNRRAMNWAGSDESAKAPWTWIETTAPVHPATDAISTPGTVTVSVFNAYAFDAGEYMLDDLHIEAGGGTVLADADFEGGLAGWRLLGTHETSAWSTNGGYGGSKGLRIRATDPGDTSYAGDQRPPPYSNRVEYVLSQPANSNTVVTLRARARWLAGHPYLMCCLNAFSLEADPRLAVPTNLGTPGLPNSRRVANAGPAIEDLTHAPVFPAAGEAPLIACRLSDPDGIAAASVRYRIDPSGPTGTVALADDGLNGDRLPGDGIWSARIPGQTSGVLVAYHVEASDLGVPAAATRFPSDAPARECLIRFGETPDAGPIMSYRLWMTATNITRWTTRDNQNNTALDGTLVYGNHRVVYNTGARYRGNWRDFLGPETSDPCGFVFTVPRSQRVTGATELKLDVPGQNATDAYLQREVVGYFLAEGIGLPASRARYVTVRVNQRYKGVLYDLQTPAAGFAESWYPDDPDPLVWRIVHDDGLGIYTNAAGERYIPRYRAGLERRRTAVPSDDFGPVLGLADVLNLADTNAYEKNTRAAVDLPGWLGMVAFNHLIVNSDAFGYAFRHNAYLHTPVEGPAMAFVYDLDNGFGSGDATNANPLASLDPYASRMVNHLPFRRIYWRRLKEFADGPMRAEVINPYIDAWHQTFLTNGTLRYNGTAPTDPAWLKNWIAGRRAYLLDRVRQVDAPFAITNNGGADFSTAAPVVLLGGTAPVEVDTFRLNGQAASAGIANVTNWSIPLALRPGTQPFLVEGLDRLGGVVATGAIAITYTGPASSPVGKLAIREIMYHPAVAGAGFVEIVNLSPTETFDLGGFVLEGVGLVFPAGSLIGPTGCVVVAANPAVYARIYGNAETVVAGYPGALDNDGETLRLLMPDGAGGWTVLDEVTYSDAPPWLAAADGLGASLQLIDPARDNNRVGNWAVAPTSSVTVCTPGRTNTTAASLPAFPDLWINEIMPRNTNFLVDNAGGFEPWIELYNGGAAPIDLAGYYLSDDGLAPAKWAFPAGEVLPAGARLLVWADGEPGQTAPGAPHASFRLDPDRGYVVLSRQDPDRVTVIDWLDYAGVADGQSYGSYPEGDPYSRRYFDQPTPGTPNNPTSAIARVWINEWMADNDAFMADPADGQFEDWFELYNAGDTPVHLGGYSLSDDPLEPSKSPIPGGFWIPAHGHRIVWADQEPGQSAAPDALHAAFKLEKNGDAIVLTAPDGTPVDAVSFGAQRTDRSEGRWRDGQGDLLEMTPPTPGTTNRAFAVMGVQCETSRVSITWFAEPARIYALESGGDLDGTHWSPVGVVTARVDAVTGIDTNPPPRHRFYRILRVE